jgi:hypothetical protein
MTMRIVRNPLAILFPNVRNFLVCLEHDLRQLKLIRILCGGVWFKSNGSWDQCDILMYSPDGTRYLSWKDVSFHETHVSVQALEVHP